AARAARRHFARAGHAAAGQPRVPAGHEWRVHARLRARRAAALSVPAIADSRYTTLRCAVPALGAIGTRPRSGIAGGELPRALAAARSDAGDAQVAATLATDAGAAARVRRLVRSQRTPRVAGSRNAG